MAKLLRIITIITYYYVFETGQLADVKNNMEVEAAMELSRHLDETGSPLVCMFGLHKVCIKFASSILLVNPNFMLGLDFCPNFMLGLDGLHNVCRWFALER